MRPGLADLALERNFNLRIFSGGSLTLPQGIQDHRNALYNLVGAPCVLVDHQHGMRQAVRHLIEVHGFRHIAFICGPQDNQEAEQRFQAYCAELAAHDIPFDPAYVAPGIFAYQSGEEAIALLLDERRLMPEAIIGVNDNTTLGAIHQLRARKLSVPGDVAVVGFDDIDHARYTTPALTTVRQPLYEQSRQAGILLLERLAGRPLPATVSTPTALVTAMVQVLQANFGGRSRTRPYLGWATGLVEAFQTALETQNPARFLSLLRSMMQQTQAELDLASMPALSAWQQVISVLRLNLFSAGLLKDASDAHAILLAEGCSGQERVLVAEMAEHIQAYRLLQNQPPSFTFK